MEAVLLLVRSEKEREELRRRMELRRAKEKKAVLFSNSRLCVEEASPRYRKEGKAGKEESIRFLSICFCQFPFVFQHTLKISLPDCEFPTVHGKKMIARIFCSRILLGNNMFSLHFMVIFMAFQIFIEKCVVLSFLSLPFVWLLAPRFLSVLC